MKGRLLVIDDEKAFCSFLRCVFNQEGYAVETVRNGKIGLERARAENFDLIITDMVMPELDGAKLIARLRADGNEVPIVAITAYSPYETKIEAAKNHRIDFVLYKPFSAQAIRNIVEAALLRVEKDEKAADISGDRYFPFHNQGI